jgi:hypothetical protein
MAHKIKSLQLMLKLNYHHFAVGNVPLFNHPPFGRPALHTQIDGTCKFDPLSGNEKNSICRQKRHRRRGAKISTRTFCRIHHADW